MTTIISRLYADSATAGSVASALKAAGLAPGDVDVIARDDAGTPDQLIERLTAAQVNPASAAAYARTAPGGGAILVARTPFTPIGIARKAIGIANEQPWIDAGIANQNEFIEIEMKREYRLSTWPGLPRFLSADMDPGENRRTEPISTTFGFRLLSKDRPRNSVWKGEPFFTAKYFPLLSSRVPRKALSEDGTVFSKFLGWPLISSR